MSYAEALRNLEQISDEIHRTRKHIGESESIETESLGSRSAGVGAEFSPLMPNASSSPELSKSTQIQKSSPPTNSSLPEADIWSDSTDTGPPDSDSGEEFLNLPEKLGSNSSSVTNKTEKENGIPSKSEYLSLSKLGGKRNLCEVVSTKPMAELVIRSQNTLQSSSLSPKHIANKFGSKVMETSFVDPHYRSARLKEINQLSVQGKSNADQPSASYPSVVFGTKEKQRLSSIENCEKFSVDSSITFKENSNEQMWTEISLVDSPDELQAFAKVGPKVRNVDRDYIHYSPLENQNVCPLDTREPLLQQSSFTETSCVQLSKPTIIRAITNKSKPSSVKKTCSSPDKNTEEYPLLSGKFPSSPAHILKTGLLRAVSVDKACASTPGKSKLDASLSGWISRSTVSGECEGKETLNRRQSLDTLLWSGPATERVKELLSQGIMMLNISSLTERRASEPKNVTDHDDESDITLCQADSGMKSRESRPGSAKKVPSPLEKSLNYLNAEEDSTSDSESLASVEMLTDDQISSLMLDQQIQDACEEVLGTPISEISPLINSIQNVENQMPSKGTTVMKE